MFWLFVHHTASHGFCTMHANAQGRSLLRCQCRVQQPLTGMHPPIEDHIHGGCPTGIRHLHYVGHRRPQRRRLERPREAGWVGTGQGLRQRGVDGVALSKGRAAQGAGCFEGDAGVQEPGWRVCAGDVGSWEVDQVSGACV